MLVEFQIASKPVIHVAREASAVQRTGPGRTAGFHRVDHSRGGALVERFAAGDPDPLADAQEESWRRCSANMMPPGRSSTTSATTGTKR